jgi:long-chain acyl-CoA synthetase
MDKIWLKSYDPGVPYTIDPDQYTSLTQMAEESFKHYAERECFANYGTVLTYQQIDALSEAFAGYLQTKCGLVKGDRLAIMLPNLLQYPIVLFGALRAGLTVVNVNPLYTGRELNVVLNDSGAKCVVVLANYAQTLEWVLPRTEVKSVIVTEFGDLLGTFEGLFMNFMIKYVKRKVPKYNLPDAVAFKSTIKAEYQKAFQKMTMGPEDVAFLQYTGGTTGGAKGAMLTHRNMISNLLQASAWLESYITEHVEGGIITALPLYHIFSLTANCLVFFRLGILNILITNPKDIPSFVKELKRRPFSMMTGVNTLFNALLHNADFCRLDFSKFKFTLGGGMAVQRPVAEKWQEVTGVALLEAYGLTETSPAVTINPLSLKKFNGSIGLPLPSTDVKICDDKGNECPIGQPGELRVHGPQVMKGYWNKPEKTKEALTPDGWLITGDIVSIDQEGFLRLVDRKKDIIIVSGFNVYPNEVEEVIAGISGVTEVAVVGVKSEEHGEIVKACIVRNDPNLTVEKIIAECHKYLTNYKVPREIEFPKELPKSNVGKVLRRELRDHIGEE